MENTSEVLVKKEKNVEGKSLSVLTQTLLQAVNQNVNGNTKTKRQKKRRRENIRPILVMTEERVKSLNLLTTPKTYLRTGTKTYDRRDFDAHYENSKHAFPATQKEIECHMAEVTALNVIDPEVLIIPVNAIITIDIIHMDTTDQNPAKIDTVTAQIEIMNQPL